MSERRGFPVVGVHGLVLKAISNVLGHGHILHADLKALRRDRERADYELSEWLNLAEATDAITIARDLLVDIQDLDTDTIRRIADELYDLNAEAERNRRDRMT